MTRIFIATFLLHTTCFYAAESSFREIPHSPTLLIETLRISGERYITSGSKLNYVKESDIPDLITLLDSTEPCAFIDLSESSIRSTGKSTVGHEAAYLIEGFWKRYYPTDLTSQRYKPNIQKIKHWYSIWSNLKKAAKQGVTANP